MKKTRGQHSLRAILVVAAVRKRWRNDLHGRRKTELSTDES